MADHSLADKNSPPLSTPDEVIGISLHDVLLFVRDGRAWLITAAAAGLLAGLAYALSAPDKFQAAASVQVAMVANEAVEPAATLAEKLKLPLYYSSETHKACGLANAPDPGEELAKRLTPVVNRSAPLVSIRFEAETAEAAEHCLKAVLTHVQANQAQLAKPLLDAKSVQLNAFKKRLKNAEEVQQELTEKVAGAVSSRDKSSTPALLLAALSSTNQDIKEMITEISKLEAGLSATQTREAGLATPVYVRDIRTSLNRVFAVLEGAIAGLFLGLATLLTRNALRGAQRRVQAVSAMPHGRR
jgi:hypothetical protein